MSARTIVIGDLHGCYHEALELLAKVGATRSDRVIFAGDLVDRGPQQRECVELAMQHEAVLGNHEEKHLQQRHRADEKLLPDHLETRRALEPHHFDWMGRLPHYLRLPEHNAVVVHAGLMPGIPVESQDPYHLLHAQCIQPPTKKSYWPSKAPQSATFWTHHWRGPERIIFGHTVFDRPLVTEHAVGIDTGCVYGRSLTAVVLPSWEFVSVPARSTYRGGKTVARIPVHGDVCAFS
ncbi:serine/threonine protein phosphatase [Corallococcus sp. H22C18031201]|uniref:metallophosphoesterase n=1 Tax=Citreicoccus inhibens TaxID=2849499 RepID=UPI000E712655|nr:metallophosphoesterase [Citreicoccus inhibens]MBU8894272.1 metallophosphoesterase [Citreicoccus inhibens]RJS23038.1 serine/threonine protein phosphatase [Corallococcus sp. H22C18031201]